MTSKALGTRKKRERQQGRPDSTGSVGKEALLEAAIEVLRSVRPEAMTMVDVAERAQVHPALVRYYFGSKDGLLREVARILVGTEQEVMQQAMDSDATLGEKLEKRLLGMINLVEANPNFHRLILDKIYGEPEEGADILARMSANGLRLTLALLHDRSGMPLRPVDPRLLHIAMVGASEFFVAAKPLLLEFFGHDVNLGDLKIRYVELLRDLLSGGLTNTTSAAAPDHRATRTDA
ncbi:TetR/AcrR family transcriptional regulator [Ralstonia sp. GX3-BWBA]|uniref:TetR/AcrR family transcriptional regulator n=1 Tax=Ralstonia sp. GX3-BWBA TaxID=2219865 RepID=UPI000DD2F05D|nr:TetR/AcrR family transcriptional regulator [Ralstonia sp. GX3-BWBA]